MTQTLKGLWQRLLRRVGAYPLMALTLLLAALAAAAWAQELDRQANSLRSALAQRRAARPAPAPVVRRVPLGEQVDAFVSGFPPLQASAGDLEQIFTSAGQHHVQLPRGEYKFKHNDNEPLSGYTVIFPVHADYAALRDFSADVLRALPNASMDELRMARSSADSTELEAVVRFTLVYRR